MGKMTKKKLMAELKPLYPDAESIVINKDGLIDVTVVYFDREYVYTYSIDNDGARYIGVTECEI